MQKDPITTPALPAASWWSFMLALPLITSRPPIGRRRSGLGRNYGDCCQTRIVFFTMAVRIIQFLGVHLSVAIPNKYLVVISI